MQRFLNVLYDLHMEAIKPDDVRTVATRQGAWGSARRRPCWAGKSRICTISSPSWSWARGSRSTATRSACNLRLSWISPWRATYIFASRSGSEVMVFAPDELAWEMNADRATLILEPVPLFDRAVSITLDYLAEQKAKKLPDATRSA
jgi:hypothetical protein